MIRSPDPFATREAALVAALARGDVRTARRLVGAGIDSQRAFLLAQRHELAGLCAWFASAEGSPKGSPLALPATLARDLRHAFVHHSLRNESLARDLRALAESLGAQGVAALYLKGPWLAFRAYPSPGARPVGDIDLCVRERDYPAVLDALERVGYRPHAPLPASGAVAMRRAHFGQQISFTARGRRPVELHFRMINFGPPSAGESWVWSTAQTFELGQRRLRVPGSEAMLLHLVLHTLQHRFSLLRLLFDIRWHLETCAAALEPDRFLDQVRELRCGPAVYHALILARELTGVHVPDDLLSPLRPSIVRSKVFTLTWRLAAVRRLDVVRPRKEVEAPFLYLLELGRLRDKWRYFAGVVQTGGGPIAFARRTLKMLAVALGRKVEGRS